MSTPGDSSPSQGASSFDVAIFEGKLILDARPPITDDARAAVEERCVGPIPPGLERLWSLSFGGRLDYSLSVTFGDIVHEFSFTELFYPGSDHYHALHGWMDHEAELAGEATRERGLPWNGKLRYLPFGGFEYLERLYVCLEDGPDYGAVFAYAHGLPPAWILHLHDQAIARIADDVPALFRALDLTVDPFEVDDGMQAGAELVSAIDQIHEVDPAFAENLRSLVRSSITNWRATMKDGMLTSLPRHRRLALAHASNEGDIDLLVRLRTLGCDLNERFRGGGGALDHALAAGRLEAARWLIDEGADVTNAIANGSSHAPAMLVQELLSRGAKPSALAATAAARAGLMDSAGLIADALAQSDPTEVTRLIDDLAHWSGRAEATAQRIDAGTLMSNRTSSQFRNEAERMRGLRNHCQSLMPHDEPPTSPKPLWRRLLGR